MPFGFRTEKTLQVARGGCGEVAVITQDGALDFFSPETGASVRVMARATAMGFSASGDRLVGIDDTGAEVVVLDTRTGAHHTTALAPPIGKNARLGVLGDRFYTCAEGILRFHAKGGEAVTSVPLPSERCEDAVAGPNGSAVGFVTHRQGLTPEISTFAMTGARSVVPMLGGGELMAQHSTLEGSDTLHEGRFLVFDAERHTPDGDSSRADGRELVVLDGHDGHELLRGWPTPATFMSREARGLFELDTGTLISMSDGLHFVGAEGAVSRIPGRHEILDVFEVPTGTAYVVARRVPESAAEAQASIPALLLDARTGETVRSLGDVRTFVHAEAGRATARSVRHHCIRSRSAPNVCRNNDPHRFIVEIDGKERSIGWSLHASGPSWVGADGSVLGPDLYPGEPPAFAEASELSNREDGLFLLRPDGTKTNVDLKAWGGLDAIVDVRGEAVLLTWSVGPGPYGGLDAEVRGTALVHLRNGLADPLVKGLSAPVLHRTFRPGFAVLIDEKREDGLVYDVFAGSLR